MSVPAIHIEHLRVCFKDRRQARGIFTALDGISFDVPAGSLFGFLGPNGAGKTTTIQALLGFLPIAGGRAEIFGRTVSDPLARQRVGFLPEPPAAYEFLTAPEWLDAVGAMFGLARAERRRRAETLIEQVGLAEAAHRRIGTFSRGMRQRLGLAQALMNDPDLLILDEPTSGMDPIGRLDMRGWMRRWREAGKTILFSSHELSEVELVCDQVAIIAKGRVVAAGRPDELCRPDERLEQAFVRWVGQVGGTS